MRKHSEVRILFNPILVFKSEQCHMTYNKIINTKYLMIETFN